MMLKHELAKSPGRWRLGYIAVFDNVRQQVVYEGPNAEDIPSLIAAMLDQLAEERESPALIRAAMAHLNLVMIHPFRDGNGRMARCLQTLILARENISTPIFSSIEEYLGANTQAYYEILASVGQGSWNPQNSARPWIRFCLTAHYRQAKTHLRRIEETEELWRRCSEVTQTHSLPERITPALMDAALGFRLRNSSYRHIIQGGAGEDISDLTASRDLKLITDSHLFEPVGERRGRYYTAASELIAIRQEIRAKRPPKEDYDPFLFAQREIDQPHG
jgi:Fic family protein